MKTGGFLRDIDKKGDEYSISYVTQNELTKLLDSHADMQKNILNNFMKVNDLKDGVWYIDMDFTNYFYFNFLAGVEFQFIAELEPLAEYGKFSDSNIYKHKLDSFKDNITINGIKDIITGTGFSKQVAIEVIQKGWFSNTWGKKYNNPDNTSLNNMYTRIINAGKSGAKLLFVNSNIYKYQNKNLVIKSYPIDFKNIKKYLSLDLYVLDKKGSSIQQLTSTSKTYKINENYFSKFLSVLGKDYASQIYNVYDGCDIKKIIIQCPNLADTNEVIISSIINNYGDHKNIVKYFTSFVTSHEALPKITPPKKEKLNQQITERIEKYAAKKNKDITNYIPLQEHLNNFATIYLQTSLGYPGFIIAQNILKYLKEKISSDDLTKLKDDIDEISNMMAEIFINAQESNDIEENQDYMSILMEEVTGDLAGYTKILDNNFSSIYNENKNVDICNKITDIIEKIIIEFVEVMLYLKNGELRFSHNDCTINNVFCNYNIDPNNIESILDIDKFSIKIGDLDKASLWYKGVRFYPEKPATIQKVTDITSNLDYYIKDYEDGWFNIFYANKLSKGIVIDVEFVSYFSRSAQVPIFLSFDFYIFILSFATNSKIFRTYIQNKIIENTSKTANQKFIHEFLKMLFAIDKDKNKNPIYIYGKTGEKTEITIKNNILLFLTVANDKELYGISNILGLYTQLIEKQQHLQNIYNINVKHLQDLLEQLKQNKINIPEFKNNIKNLYLANNNFTISRDSKLIISTPLQYQNYKGTADAAKPIFQRVVNGVFGPAVDINDKRISLINDRDNMLPVPSKIYFRTNYFSNTPSVYMPIGYIKNHDAVENKQKFDEYLKNLGLTPDKLLPSPSNQISVVNIIDDGKQEIVGSGFKLAKTKLNINIVWIAVLIVLVLLLIYYFTKKEKFSLKFLNKIKKDN